MNAYKPIRAPRGAKRSCRGWHQEAALRMLMNNLDEEVAENPRELVVYGGSGKAARNWVCYHAIVRSLRGLANDETLLVQSGKPVGVVKTFEHAPRVLIANSNLVGHWANWDEFRRLEALGLMMYGQMTAGSWMYIGSQGIVQGTFETFEAAAEKHFQSDLTGRLVVSGGLGGMGGAQPLAATMAGAAFLGVEVDPARIEKRLRTGYCDRMTASLDEALDIVLKAKARGAAISVGLVGNCAEVLPELVRRGVVPDVLTDQTSAHDPLNGYVPAELSLPAALELRRKSPAEYTRRAMDSIATHVRAMLDLQKAGAVTFDYGNNIRTMAFNAGVKNAYDFPGFVPAYIRPLFCEGRGPFRWIALSGDPADIVETDRFLLKLFPKNRALKRWIPLAQQKIKFQGLPARICWLGLGERAEMGLAMNELVRKGKVKAPIVIGRDHLDTGSVASPFRETEAMKDGSDAIADWPILNALMNTASGASWVSFHHGGGVGIGYSLHAGQAVVCDGTKAMDGRIERVLTNDPLLGVLRHADAGYDEAKRTLRKTPVNSLFIRNCSQLLTLRGSSLGIIPHGTMLTDGANIVAVGTERAVSRLAKRAREIDARGCVVLPGFVDSHSHPVFAASRVEEFEMRLRGATYEQIAAAGGGIMNSARKLRATSEATLLKNLRVWTKRFLEHGTTTLEAKSGYALNWASERKMLRVIRQANRTGLLELVPTFLGAHTVPAEYRSRRAEYVRQVCEEMIPAVTRDRLAEFCDVFCERTAFTVPESRRILTAAKRAGLKLKIHADQLTRNGGARLAAELGAVSADHLECANAADARALKKGGVIATLLPAVTLHLGRGSYPPARTLIDAGVTVALATDFNPGTCPTPNMQLVIAIACSQMRMTPAEAIRAATINGARALCREDRIGSLEAGKQADVIVLDVADYRELPYYFGVNHCRFVVKRGRVVA